MKQGYNTKRDAAGLLMGIRAILTWDEPERWLRAHLAAAEEWWNACRPPGKASRKHRKAVRLAVKAALLRLRRQ